MDNKDKPQLNISESESQALLTINNLQTSQTPKTKPPLKLFIAVLGIIIFVVVVSYLLGAVGSGGSTKSANPTGLQNQSDPTNGKGVSSQINQDEKACSNPLNALTVC